MTYYTSTELVSIKKEIDEYLSNAIDKEIKQLKNTAEPNNKVLEKLILLGICQEIIEPYQAVTESTDGVINNILEKDLQTIVEKVYRYFFNLNYPRMYE